MARFGNPPIYTESDFNHDSAKTKNTDMPSRARIVEPGQAVCPYEVKFFPVTPPSRLGRFSGDSTVM